MTTRFGNAITDGDTQTVKEIIAAGTDVNAPSDFGYTPLALAVESNQRDMAAFLIARGAKVNNENPGWRDSWTPLHYAAYKGQFKMAELLLANGSDPNIPDDKGQTPLSLAVDRLNLPMVDLLKKASKGSSRAKAGRKKSQPGTASDQAPIPAAAPVSDIDNPSYRLPARPSDFALIVGVEHYANLPSASFAERDAEAVKKHFLALGLPPRNIIHLSGQSATRAGLQSYIEEWLPKNTKPDSTVFFYYSGHGAPEYKTGQAYLVPWDADAKFLQSTAYPLKQLYASLAKLKAKQVIVAIDSCFSGAGGRSVLAQGTRPLVTKVDEGFEPARNITLLAAASGDEITGSFEEQGHGLFTYYFLKGLSGKAKDASGKVTAQALYDYIKPNVEDEAHRQNREQTPTLRGARSEQVIVR